MIRHHLVRKHRTARSLVRKAMEDQLKEVGELAARFPAHPLCPEDGEFSFSELVESVKSQGRWAFVRFYGPKRPAELHWWVADDTSPEDIAEMIGHELGHLTEGVERDDVLEEQRADGYGAVAREATTFLKRLGRSRRSVSGRSARARSRGRSPR